MKRIVLLLTALLATLGAIALPCAADQSFGWYCKHVPNHEQPPIAPELAFVESYGGYYLDHGQRDEKVIYLTFDAGYENGNVEKTLDVLKEKDVRGAFFVLKNLIVKNTELVERMAREGHTVCNHTVRHRDMSLADDAALLEELHALEAIYTEQTGRELSHYYRPPEGRFSQQNMRCLFANGYKTVFWSFAYPDWNNEKQMSPEKARSIILDNAHDGAVMLLHPTSATNAAILGDVIDALRQEGYRFGTLDELTEAGA